MLPISPAYPQHIPHITLKREEQYQVYLVPRDAGLAIGAADVYLRHGGAQGEEGHDPERNPRGAERVLGLLRLWEAMGQEPQRFNKLHLRLRVDPEQFTGDRQHHQPELTRNRIIIRQNETLTDTDQHRV